MIKRLYAFLFRRARPEQSMVYQLFTLISRLDQEITRDRAAIIAAEIRIEEARRRKALAQRMLAGQRK